MDSPKPLCPLFWAGSGGFGCPAHCCIPPRSSLSLPEDTGVAAQQQRVGRGGLRLHREPTAFTHGGAHALRPSPPGGAQYWFWRQGTAELLLLPPTSSRMPSVAPGPAPAPGALGQTQEGGQRPKRKGPGTAPHTSCPSPHQQPQGTSWGSPAPPSTSWGRNKRAKALFGGSLAVPGCSSVTVLLREPAGCTPGAGRGRAERRLRAAARLSCALVLIRSRKTLIRASRTAKEI